jgi:hypothetical protein
MGQIRLIYAGLAIGLMVTSVRPGNRAGGHFLAQV